MRVVTSDEMKSLDNAAINDYGVPGVVLMENAGRRVAEVVRKVLGDLRGKVVTVFAGKGNNGGDGLVAARHLLNMGADVKVMMLANIDHIKGDARINLDIWRKMGQKTYSVHQGNEINVVRLILMNTGLIVDAIYGTGFRGKMDEKVGRMIEVLNGCGKPIVAVDIPSGLNADTGRVDGPCIQATHTVTFGLPKLGLFLEEGADYAGELHVADISIPSVLVEKLAPQRYMATADLVRSWLPRRSSGAHKGDFGRVLVLAGSRGMTGAASLAGDAALKAGAGLVTVAVPETLHDIMEVKLTEVMTIPLPDTGKGAFSTAAGREVLAIQDKFDVLAVGPGISTVTEVVALVRELLPEVRIPCVLDADALNALAGAEEILNKIQAPVVITPHPGEMGRLLGKSASDIQSDRLAAASKAAGAWGVVALLKGARTVVAAPDGSMYINPTGNPGMATGGSGDVLTGVIAALIAQGLEPAMAAAGGAYIHGLAGDLAAEKKGMIGLTAGDVLEALPAAAMKLASGN